MDALTINALSLQTAFETSWGDDMTRMKTHYAGEDGHASGCHAAVSIDAGDPNLSVTSGFDEMAVCVAIGHVSNAAEIRELYGIGTTHNIETAAKRPRIGGEGVDVLLAVVDEETPGEEIDTSKLLLDLYASDFADVYGDPSEQPETLLASLQGDFAFVLIDVASRYMLVAASKGNGPCASLLHWAPTKDGALAFSTKPHVLRSGGDDDVAAAPATRFPGGCFFANSDRHEEGSICKIPSGAAAAATAALTGGRKRGREKVLPRVNSSGVLCGFHSASGTDLSSLNVVT